MKITKEKIKEVTSKIIEDIIDEDMLEWPPGCATYIYQPERPDNETIPE